MNLGNMISWWLNRWFNGKINRNMEGNSEFKHDRGEKNRIRHVMVWIGMLFLCFLCFHLFAGFTALEAKTCIPIVKLIPGNTGPAENPDWYSPNQIFPDAYLPSDVRWTGSVTHNYCFGSTSHAEFRALYNVENNVKVLYLSFELKIAPSSPKGNALYLGFYNPGEAAGTIIKILLEANSTELDGVMIPKPVMEGNKIFYIPSVVRGTGTTAWKSVPAYPWITDKTRVWMSNSNKKSWTVEMRIPIDANAIENGLPITNTHSFRMWVYFQAGGPKGSASSVIPYTLPRTEDANPTQYIYREINNTPTYPDPAEWEEVSLVDPQAGADCQSGVLIASHLIGTSNIPASKMNLYSANTFFARPLNYSQTPVPAGNIKATFKISNWGSTCTDINSGTWTSIPGGTDVGAATQIPGESDAGPGVGYMFFQWAMTPEQRCSFIGKNGVPYPNANPPIPGDLSCPNDNPVQMLQQCVSVKLTGTGLNFIRDTAFRNMVFVGLPTLVQPAEISVAGLPPVSSSRTREVYLLLERRNMPGNMSFKQKEPVVKIATRAGLIMDTTQPPANHTVAGEALRSFDSIAETQPTYVVHAYHDTGKTVDFGGKKHAVYLPQTSFGYFMTFNGELEGWKSSLSGKGLRSAGGDLYRISVPGNGVATVMTSIGTVQFRKFAVSARVGIDFPAGVLNTNYNTGLSFNVGAEYMLKRYLSVEGSFGFHRFPFFGSEEPVPLNMYQYTIGGRYYFYNIFQRVKPFLNFAVGFYRSSVPLETNFGVNLGGGVDYYLTNVFALELAYNYHTLSVGEPNTKFSTLQAGVRYRF